MLTVVKFLVTSISLHHCTLQCCVLLPRIVQDKDTGRKSLLPELHCTRCVCGGVQVTHRMCVLWHVSQTFFQKVRMSWGDLINRWLISTPRVSDAVGLAESIRLFKKNILD